MAILATLTAGLTQDINKYEPPSVTSPPVAEVSDLRSV